MCLRPFDHVLAVSAETRDLSMKLGFTSVTPDVVGDTRYDQVIRRTEDAERVVAPLRPLKCGRPCLVFGSTWPSDESVVFGLLRGFRERGMEVWSVLVPHEPTKKHLRQIELECDAAGLRWKRLSAVSMDPGSPAGRDAPDVNAPDPAVFDHQVFDVLIVDRVGILANLYALADAAFVGGGFGPGVHSVLEPAAFGKPVFFGPRCRNSFEAGQLETRGGGMVVRDGGEFTDLLLPLLQDPAKLRAAGENALALVRDNIGATERIADRLAAIVRSRD
jgi:3-deoxy-D-manno-octulosonic-acid transferase